MSAEQQKDGQTAVPPVGNSYLLHGPESGPERKEREQQEYQKERDSKEDAYKNRQLSINDGQLITNRRIALYTLVLAVLSVLGLVVSFLSSQAAKRSAEAAIEAANVARDALDSNNISSGDVLIQMKNQSWAMRRSAEASKNAAKTAAAALDASIAASRLDMRPLVVLSKMYLLEEPKAGKPIQAVGILTNAGKTPAISTYVRSNTTVWTKDAPQPIDKTLESPSSSHRNSEIIAPGGIGNTFFYPDARILSVEQAAAYRAGKTRIMFVARVDYADTFSESVDHWTKICVSFVTGHLTEFEWCPHENEIDTEKNKPANR